MINSLLKREKEKESWVTASALITLLRPLSLPSPRKPLPCPRLERAAALRRSPSAPAAASPSQRISAKLDHTGYHLPTWIRDLWKPSLRMPSSSRPAQGHALGIRLLCHTNSVAF